MYCISLLYLLSFAAAAFANGLTELGLGALDSRDSTDDVQTQDPYDLSFYTKGAAIGDSYTAGIGAGNRVGWACSRYDGSYANLVALQLGVDLDKLDFTYTACSGAVVDEIITQAKALSSGQEFVMLSAVFTYGVRSDISLKLNSDREAMTLNWSAY